MMKYYKTRPCIIQAMEWTGNNIGEIKRYGGDQIDVSSGIPVIHTLEGDMTANIGDFIILGLRGEFYPCKPDVFHKKYEECI